MPRIKEGNDREVTEGASMDSIASIAITASMDHRNVLSLCRGRSRVSPIFALRHLSTLDVGADVDLIREFLERNLRGNRSGIVRQPTNVL